MAVAPRKLCAVKIPPRFCGQAVLDRGSPRSPVREVARMQAVTALGWGRGRGPSPGPQILSARPVCGPHATGEVRELLSLPVAMGHPGR